MVHRVLFLAIFASFLTIGYSSFLDGLCHNTTCGADGECIPVISGGSQKYWCKCNAGFSGKHCEMPPCPDICHNEGECVKPLFGTMADYYCKCAVGFEGRYCEKEVESSVCTEVEPCGEQGTCFLTNSLDEYRCECVKGFRGVNCTEKEPCPPGYCVTGTCSPAANKAGFFCECPDNFQGDRCDVDVDECAQSPCANGGVCENKFGDFVCHCPYGFLGERCELNATALFPKRRECSIEGEDVCLNGGVCRENYEGSWACSCPPMFEGPRCEKDINECERLSPCQNGGTCANFDGGFECICPIGIEGEYCEISEDFCSPNPCQSGICVSNDQAVCLCPPGTTGQFCDKVDYCLLAEPCKNGAQCHTNVATGEFTCLCMDGFKGEFCEEDVDECLTGRGLCYNNGTCKNTPGGYTCDCPKPFGGEFCEEVLTACRPNPCRNGGMCLDRIDSFECACRSGYSGARCEILPPLVSSCRAGDCKNGGSCHAGQCVCTKGFTGPFCQKKIDAANAPGRCLSNPCLHGFCQESEDDYRCHCYPGFAGRKCEIDIDDCKPGLCANSGECIDLENGYTCACKKGFSGKYCEQTIDLINFNKTEMHHKQLCEMHGCEGLSGNGRCDQECNHFACGFDGGECSANAKPYERCHSASYCARVFHDGNCDETCNNEACLFDGFDCAGSPSKCPHAEFCEKNYANGFCDTLCNNTACGFDGGDCESREELLNGEIVLVVLTSPSDFRQRVNTFLMTLSGTLRSSVKIRSDGQGPLVFEWKDGYSGPRVPLDIEQPLSVSFAGVVRRKRAVHEQGVIVWLTIDVSNCRRDCFGDISTVAEFLGRAEAQMELGDLGMPIKEARVDRRDPSGSRSVFGIVLAVVGVCILVAVVGVVVINSRERTRKRRVVNAPTWFPPSEGQYKMLQQKIAEYSRNQSLYGSQGDLYSSIKRSRLDSPSMMSSFGEYGPLQLPELPFQNQVFAVPPAHRSFPDYSDLHEKAASFDPIPLPIDAKFVNERNGPGGVTPLVLLARNRGKCIKHILEDVENLYKAGANLDAQDEDEQTALFIASRLGRVELAKKLLELGANPTKMDSQDSTPLHQAAHNGDIMLVRELLQHEAVRKEVDEVDKMGRTALMCSSLNDFLSTEVAAALIDAGADPSYQGDKSALTYRGRSAMHYAAQYGNMKTLKFLIEIGADKNAQDLEECTPLILAVRSSRVRSVQALIDAGASQDISDQTDSTPRTIAKDTNQTNILEILENARVIYDEVIVPLPERKSKINASTAKKLPLKRKPAQQQKRKPAQPLTPPHSDGSTTTPDAFHISQPMLFYLDSPRSDGSSNTTTSPVYTNHMSYDGPGWATMMPAATFPSHLQKTFTSDYNSAGSSFESSSFFQLGADYPNTSNVWN